MTHPSSGVSLTVRSETRPRGRMVPRYVPSLPGFVQPINPDENELPPDTRPRKDNSMNTDITPAQHNALLRLAFAAFHDRFILWHEGSGHAEAWESDGGSEQSCCHGVSRAQAYAWWVKHGGLLPDDVDGDVCNDPDCLDPGCTS
jgi:hypothetical protein